ncbi:mitochondrial carrier [Meredithblackwellia eburnea MCA 4105]
MKDEQGRYKVDPTTADFIAGWLGGAVGILVSNPLEVLKVRLQTHSAVPPTKLSSTSSTSPTSTKTPRVGAGSRTPSSSPTASTSSSPPPPTALASKGRKPSLVSLWRAEGTRVFFAGALAPILGLAFIDSAFFGGYGMAMSAFHQSRQDPTSLPLVFASGALSGGTCALLQTPIEVVKCRAQYEKLPKIPGSDSMKQTVLNSPFPSAPSSSGTPAPAPEVRKQGSIRIAMTIAKEQGLKGFYVGGLMTACRDGISSGLFFWGYFVFRRALRGEHPFQPSSSILKPNDESLSPSASTKHQAPRIDKLEVGRMLLAGGLAGTLSAVVPYPFDIVKTRLQTTVASLVHPSPVQIIREIHSEGVKSIQYRYTSTLLYSFLSKWLRDKKGEGRVIDGRLGGGGGRRAEYWAKRLGAYGAFFKGLGPTIVGSFVGSAVTITTFEMALVLMGAENSGGGVG